VSDSSAVQRTGMSSSPASDRMSCRRVGASTLWSFRSSAANRLASGPPDSTVRMNAVSRCSASVAVRYFSMKRAAIDGSSWPMRLIISILSSGAASRRFERRKSSKISAASADLSGAFGAAGGALSAATSAFSRSISCR